MLVCIHTTGVGVLCDDAVAPVTGMSWQLAKAATRSLLTTHVPHGTPRGMTGPFQPVAAPQAKPAEAIIILTRGPVLFSFPGVVEVYGEVIATPR